MNKFIDIDAALELGVRPSRTDNAIKKMALRHGLDWKGLRFHRDILRFIDALERAEPEAGMDFYGPLILGLEYDAQDARPLAERLEDDVMGGKRFACSCCGGPIFPRPGEPGYFTEH